MGHRVDARIVHDDVKPPALLHDRGQNPIDFRSLRYVEMQCSRRLDSFRGCTGARFVHIRVKYLAAIGRQTIRDCLAYAARPRSQG